MAARLLRVIPAALVTVLLVLTALSHSARVRAAGPAAAAAATYYPGCSLSVQSGGSGSLLELAPGDGVTQPLGVVANISACSLDVRGQGRGGFANVRLVAWDPSTLTPDPTTVALRTWQFQTSGLSWGARFRWDPFPPLVVRALSGLAEQPRSTIALDYQRMDSSVPESLGYQAQGAAGVPQAYRYTSATPRAPLGPHALLTHRICGGDESFQQLHLVQSVMTTNTLYDTTYDALAQRFRVPARTTLERLELAYDWREYRPGAPSGQLQVFDGEGTSTPPGPGATLLASATLWMSYPFPSWGAHYDFDHVPTLLPDHDYWIVIGGQHAVSVYARNLTGAESAAYQSAIGPFFSRVEAAGAWTPQTTRSLCFRAVGVPQGVLGVTNPAAPASALRLRATPVPASTQVLLAWSGARGNLRFEVLDARGRRVGAGEGAGGSEGNWVWRAVGTGGGALPGGVYFVRARDADGRTAVQRVVIVR